jgi:hypothetical protein
VALSDKWPLKRGAIHMKFSMTVQEKVTFQYRWLLNRGVITLHFSLLCDVVHNTLTVVLSPYTSLCCVQPTELWYYHLTLLSLLCDVVYNTLTVVLSPYTSLSVVWCCYTAVYVHSRFKSSLGLMLCVIDISTLNKTYLIWFDLNIIHYSLYVHPNIIHYCS